MKRTLEILISALFVLVPTWFVYQALAPVSRFWDAQIMWSVALVACWMIVASGYYHQGSLVRKRRDVGNVSLVLPLSVFVVQCILFVKGIYYHDYSLIIGALLVNSGVFYSLYNIIKFRKKS